MTWCSGVMGTWQATVCPFYLSPQGFCHSSPPCSFSWGLTRRLSRGEGNRLIAPWLRARFGQRKKVREGESWGRGLFPMRSFLGDLIPLSKVIASLKEQVNLDTMDSSLCGFK